jgi:hypothetical protein
VPEEIQTVLRILDTYIQQFRPQLSDKLLYQVIKRIIPKLDDPALLEAEVNQLTEQVIAEFHRRGIPIPPPPPDPKSEAVAAQVAEEIAQFQAEQAAMFESVDLTRPQIMGELEVSSQLKRMPAK